MTQLQLIQSFTEDLEDALENIHEVYHGLNYWHHTEEFLYNYGKLAQFLLRSYLDRYHERVFCYELYHQVRHSMENRLHKNQNIYRADNIFLQSELTKMQVNSFVEIIFKIRRLAKEYMPDFLLHTPGNFSNQLIVMEVKSTPKLDIDSVIYDLTKINEFISNYQYQKGIFIAINIEDNIRDAFLNKIADWRNEAKPNSSQMTLYFKKDPWTKFTKYNLAFI